MEDLSKYGLDLRCTLMLEDFIRIRPVLERMRSIAEDAFLKVIKDNNVFITTIESRVKSVDSLAGKLELKGGKYNSIYDLTDLLGVRVVTFYTDDVDKVSAMAERLFEIDWKNSVDKRKTHALDRFGYNSLHFICRIPKNLYYDSEHPEINEIWFEIQMRTALQHVWATMDHDTGYKSGVEIPTDYLRNLNRIAGMLELADEQFSQIRTAVNNYRRTRLSLVNSGNFADVPLDVESFRNYLNLDPFGKLNKKIAAINQAEIHQTSQMPYLNVLKKLEFQTLGEVDSFIRDNFDDAYQLAVFQLGNTDIDIIDSSVAVLNLCVVYILKNGGTEDDLKTFFDFLNGKSDSNADRATRVYGRAKMCSFMHNHKKN